MAITNNKVMETVLLIAKMKGIKQAALMAGESSRTIFYNRLKGTDMKVQTLMKYAEIMNCEIVIKDKESPTEWRLE